MTRQNGPSREKPAKMRMGWVLSVAAHLMVLAALLWLPAVPPPVAPSPIVVSFVDAGPEPPGPPGDDAGGSPQETLPQAPPQPVAAAPAPRPLPKPEPTPEPDDIAPPPPDTSDLLTDAQLVGAATVDDMATDGGSGAGSGVGGGNGAGNGGGCDTARLLQRALQRDPLVRRAVMDADRAGKAVILWNGDWVRSGAQDGKGLSGVRQAITWELAFAPAACRTARVQGLVLLSLADGTRFAIGTNDWRWSDLLGLSQEAH